MENQKQTLTGLYQDFLDNKTSPEQIRELKKLFKSKDEATLRILIFEALRHHEGEARIDEDERLAQIFDNVKTEISKERRINRFPLYVRIMAVAAMVTVISLIGIGIYSNDKKARLSEETANATIDVSPGSNKAILTLTDGRKINLNDAKKGMLANQSGITTTKNSEGVLTYKGAESSAPANAFNIIETPRGGEFQVQLPDGTKVWLNAASSLKYPLSFSALKERRVELTGEAYFEVAHNKAQPFRVVSSGQTVEVLGTHFNINSYADEMKIITTLEEGSVKVISNNQYKTIRPGEQTSLNPDGNIAINEADLQTALAWKNGKIYFRDADIRTILRQASRWYNIDVEFQGNIPQWTFNGGVARTANLSSLLKILELNNIHFTIETNGSNKKLIVKP